MSSPVVRLPGERFFCLFYQSYTSPWVVKLSEDFFFTGLYIPISGQATTESFFFGGGGSCLCIHTCCQSARECGFFLNPHVARLPLDRFFFPGLYILMNCQSVRGSFRPIRPGRVARLPGYVHIFPDLYIHTDNQVARWSFFAWPIHPHWYPVCHCIILFIRPNEWPRTQNIFYVYTSPPMARLLWNSFFHTYTSRLNGCQGFVFFCFVFFRSICPNEWPGYHEIVSFFRPIHPHGWPGCQGAFFFQAYTTPPIARLPRYSFF